ncbi:MAG: PaaI family thioesterase [Acidimicrobiia bacterium]|jgi:acyl-coenzyme A thioesterase PaaI-like protein|nr:MAG: PaaI family thioesterase [Acidimicrobiia bacterium]
MEFHPLKDLDAFVEWLFAPWVKAQGLEFLEVERGRVVARLPQDPSQQFVSGAMCGQSLMSAIDTVMSVAMATGDSLPRGTQHIDTHFLHPAEGEALLVEAVVKRWGRTSYGDVHVRLESSGALVAHATASFAF